MIRFGKPSGPLLAQKGTFFESNDELQERVREIGAIYVRQPKRSSCKNCSRPLAGLTFTKMGIDYVQCENCGHLNGRHEDTEEFVEAVYTGKGGAAYASTYGAADLAAYESRVKAIYAPKAAFLFDVIGDGAKDLSFADMGAGSGYFVAALRQAGAENVVGYDVSETQVSLAREMSGGTFRLHALGDTARIVAGVEADVVSFIGVLEHLRDPRAVLAALQANRTIRYAYLSIPMFSVTVFLEAVFPSVFHRHLGAGHTHLYTDSSLDWMCREFGFTRVGEWWFGTDMVDLYRDVIVSLGKSAGTANLSAAWHDGFGGVIDALQLELDKRKLSSEVHVVLRKE